MAIRTSNELREADSGAVVIEGTAHSFKGRAFVAMVDEVLFCFVDGRRDWPEGIEGRLVHVSGELRVERVMPEPTTRGGLTLQGIHGESFVIVPTEWSVLDSEQSATENGSS